MPNDMRDRLIELYDQTNDECDSKDCLSCKYWNASYCRVHKFIDKIIAKGAILPPCKVGDTVYKFHTVNLKPNGEITKRTIKQITFSAFTVTDDGASGWFDIDDIGKTVFLTREDAEKALRERELK